MSEFIATFYTHLSAMSTLRTLTKNGIKAKMEPAPRALGASCGSSVRFFASDACVSCMHRDYQAVYIVADGGYKQVKANDAPV